MKIFLIIFCLAIVLTWPAFLHLNEKYMGDGGDSYEYASYSLLVAKQLREFKFPFSHTNFWRYPNGFDFSRGSDSYLTTFLGGVLTLIFNAPAGYNLAILLIMTTNGWLSYLFFKNLTSSTRLGLAGMIIYGFSFNSLAKGANHANLLFTGGLVLYAYAIWQFVHTQNITTKQLIIFFLGLFLTILGSTEYFLMLLFFTFIYWTVCLIFFREDLISLILKLFKVQKKFFLGLLVTGILTTLVYQQFIFAFIRKEFIPPQRENYLDLYTPSTWDYLLPNKFFHLQISKYLSSPSYSTIERSVFFGFAEIILFLGFCLTQNHKRSKLFVLAFFLIPFLLSMGYGRDNSFFLLPYHFLRNSFPFNIMTQPGRFVVIAYFFSSIGIILFLQKYQKNWKFLFLIIALLVLERLPYKTYLSDALNNESYYSTVAKQDSLAVIDLPINIFYQKHNINSFYYNKPIINGYIHFPADGKKEKEFITKNYWLTRFICSEDDPILKMGVNEDYEDTINMKMLDWLNQSNITTFVIHKDDKLNHPVCTNVRLRLNRLFPFQAVLRPTKEEKVLSTMMTNGKPKFTVYFPQNGEFFIDGVTFNPTYVTSYYISQNDKPISLDYHWEIDNNQVAILFPKYKISLPVNAGSFITFYSDAQQKNTYFGLWYRYIATDGSSAQKVPIRLENIYEDEKAAVYKLNKL